MNEEDKNELVNDLIKMLENMQKKIRLLAQGQLFLSTYLADKFGSDFQKGFVVAMLEDDKLRNDFTEFINETSDDDDIKAQMIEMNEFYREEKGA
tara:strand:+ start:205 stop:489 length:285 start_codon:yes stop_codon:yes gene_type:complete